jgi:hypothetical protein
MLTFYSLQVTWCTNRFNIQKLYILSTLYLSQNKQQLLPYITQTIGFYDDENVFTVRYELRL